VPGDIYEIRYSHGGSSLGPWTAVSGAVTGGGRPISVIGSTQNCAMSVGLSVGTATVTIEASAGALDSTGNPPADSWRDMSDSGTGWDLDAADPTTMLAKSIPALRFPLWRTRIIAISGGGAVTSLIPFINQQDSDGVIRQISASYPPVSQFTTQGQ
jgi:hypothetical protein